MKKSLLLFIALPFIVAGCDLLKDATTVTIDTTLKANIPVVVVNPGKGELTAISFTKTQDLTLSSNADLEPYLSKIEEISLSGVTITITGLQAGQTIQTVSLDVAGVGTLFTQTNISSTNSSFTPAVDNAKLNQAATKLTNDLKLTLTVSGTASGPMTFTVGTNFTASVVAAALGK